MISRKVTGLLIALTGFIMVFYSACNHSSNSGAPSSSCDSGPTSSSKSVLGSTLQGSNVMGIQIGNMSVCSKNDYLNEPCTSVTICAPGTTNCQTITDVLVDTGSYGLRLFTSTITVPLTQSTTLQGRPIAECAMFGTGSTWGPVKTANVILGNEPAVTVPIQVIDPNFQTVVNCPDLDTDPVNAGFNGILGIGPLILDQQLYYCFGGSCNSKPIAPPNQVQNPVAALSGGDSRGVGIILPPVPTAGAFEVLGTLVIGIDSQANNSSAGTTLYSLDSFADLTTTFSGTTFKNESFIDTGSNGLFFPTSGGLTDCSSSSSAPGFFCPCNAGSFSATITAASGPSSVNIGFQINSAVNLLNTGNNAFNNVGGDLPGVFDWGLPFFFGRTVYFGIQGKTSNLGPGPYVAF